MTQVDPSAFVQFGALGLLAFILWTINKIQQKQLDESQKATVKTLEDALEYERGRASRSEALLNETREQLIDKTASSMEDMARVVGNMMDLLRGGDQR